MDLVSYFMIYFLNFTYHQAQKCSISQLFDYNTSADFLDQSISCGKCCQRTGHQLSYEHQSDIIMLEIIRVSEKKRGNRITWRKNMLPISFPTSGISVPGLIVNIRWLRVVIIEEHFDLVTGLPS